MIMDQGRIAFEGTIEAVRNSTDPLVYQYIHELPDGPVQFHYPAGPLAGDFGLSA